MQKKVFCLELIRTVPKAFVLMKIFQGYQTIFLGIELLEKMVEYHRLTRLGWGESKRDKGEFFHGSQE
jgi:hypothetical protein